MNIYKHELRLYLKTTIIWNLSLLSVMLFFSTIYPAFKDSTVALKKVLESFPDTLKQALGLSTMDISSVLGFFGFMFTYIILIGGVQAMNLGLSILSNEQRDKTADFLLAKPVKRIQVLHSKLAAAFTYIITTNIIFSIFSFSTLVVISGSNFSITILILFLGSLLFSQLFFMTFGMLLSVFMDKLKTVVPISLGTVFGFFILNMLNESIAGRPLSPLTPFAYFNASYIYVNSAFEMKWLLLNLLLIVFFTTIAYIRYIKKDIPSV